MPTDKFWDKKIAGIDGGRKKEEEKKIEKREAEKKKNTKKASLDYQGSLTLDQIMPSSLKL